MTTPGPEAGPSQPRPIHDDPPPFLRTWPNVYRAVLAYLALVILGLYGIRWAFTT
jgi:hypothetical protein